MKLAVILPSEMPEEACAVLNAEFSRFLLPSTQTAIIGLENTTIECADDFARLTPLATAAAQKADKDGFDGIVLDGA